MKTIELASLATVTGGAQQDAKKIPLIRATSQAQVDQQIAHCQAIHGKPVLDSKLGMWAQPELASYAQCLAGGERFETDRD